jgi:hypothetical protein
MNNRFKGGGERQEVRRRERQEGEGGMRGKGWWGGDGRSVKGKEKEEGKK